MNLQLIFACICSLALIGHAAPTLTDMHSTSLSMVKTSPIERLPGSDSFMVTVSRIDELVDSNGVGIAERIQSVQLAFDVVDNQLHCNGHMLPNSGVVLETINAQFIEILPADNAESVHREFEQGLVKVEFKIDSKQVHVAGQSIRRLLVVERIVEINKATVEQFQATQVMIDIRPDGTFEQYPPQPAVLLEIVESSEVPAHDVPMDVKPGPDAIHESSSTDSAHSSTDYSFTDRINHLPPHIFGVFLGAMVALASAFVALAVHFANLMLSNRREQMLLSKPSSSGYLPVVYKEVVVDEKSFCSAQSNAGNQTGIDKAADL